MFALVDCNNFFVSCERIFRPDLEGKPTVVLSSNDGCAIARSNEAKALGIPMGAPIFKYRHLIEASQPLQLSAMHGDREERTEPYTKYGEGVPERATQQRASRDGRVFGSAKKQASPVQRAVAFSANFELYGDISSRISNLLCTIAPRIEVYSIDESFLDISELDINDYEAWGRAVKARVQKEIGVPVSIGIATTKTLAKLGSELAKKDQGSGGVVWVNQQNREGLLARVPIKDVWGIGWRLAPKLRAEGVGTALALSEMRPRHAQSLMGVHGSQMVHELNGVCCLPLERHKGPQKSIMRGRTFGEDTSEAYVLEAAITTLTARAAYRLRKENQLVRKAGILIHTNRHKPGYERFFKEVTFTTPTADTGLLCRKLVDALGEVYSSKKSYHRANVLFYELVSEESVQLDLLSQQLDAEAAFAYQRMKALDDINSRFGAHKLYFAAEDLAHTWEPKRSLQSPCYTTRWQDLPTARTGH